MAATSRQICAREDQVTPMGRYRRVSANPEIALPARLRTCASAWIWRAGCVSSSMWLSCTGRLVRTGEACEQPDRHGKPTGGAAPYLPPDRPADCTSLVSGRSRPTNVSGSAKTFPTITARSSTESHPTGLASPISLGMTCHRSVISSMNAIGRKSVNGTPERRACPATSTLVSHDPTPSGHPDPGGPVDEVDAADGHRRVGHVLPLLDLAAVPADVVALDVVDALDSGKGAPQCVLVGRIGPDDLRAQCRQLARPVTLGLAGERPDAPSVFHEPAGDGAALEAGRAHDRDRLSLQPIQDPRSASGPKRTRCGQAAALGRSCASVPPSWRWGPGVSSPGRIEPAR